MRLTNYSLNHGIRWPYLNRPYPALNYGSGLLTNQLTSITSEASTVYVRNFYHRDCSYYNCPRFVPRPRTPWSARIPSTRLVFHLLDSHRGLNSSSDLWDPSPVFSPEELASSRDPPSVFSLPTIFADTGTRPRPLKSALLLTWQCHDVI